MFIHSACRCRAYYKSMEEKGEIKKMENWSQDRLLSSVCGAKEIQLFLTGRKKSKNSTKPPTTAKKLRIIPHHYPNNIFESHIDGFVWTLFYASILFWLWLGSLLTYYSSNVLSTTLLYVLSATHIESLCQLRSYKLANINDNDHYW